MLATIAHPVIAHEDPVAGDSFPMVGQRETRRGRNLVGRQGWKYSLSTNGPNGQLLGIRKTLNVNRENFVRLNFDKLQGREILLHGKSELLEIGYDSSFRPIRWEAKVGDFALVEEAYDRFGRLTGWKRGRNTEVYEYDARGRLTSVGGGNVTVLKYYYDNGDDIVNPSKVETAGGGNFVLEYDANGALSRLQTPRGHFHAFETQPGSPSGFKTRYFAPWVKAPYEIVFDNAGNVLSKKVPGVSNSGETFKYDEDGNILRWICGDFDSVFSYDDSNLLESAVTRSGHSFEMKIRNKYHSGLLKEQKIRFSGSQPQLSSAVFRWQYDGFGRLSGFVSNVGDRQQTMSVGYDDSKGSINQVGGLKVISDFNRYTLEDVNNNFFKSVEFNGNGKVSRISYGFRSTSSSTLKLTLEYDDRDRLKKRVVNSERAESFSYSADGQLISTGSFNYRYDANGNLVGKGRLSLEYDVGDRVQKLGAKTRIAYDEIGNVRAVGDRHRFRHDASGRLREYVVLDNGRLTRVNYLYDLEGRLVAWFDSAGRVQQFFYADPEKDRRVTHVHNPKSGLTQRLIYDPLNEDHLSAVETSDGQRIMIATDESGSPLAAFRASDGKPLKELRYSPFGNVARDSNPGMILPLGFRGFLALPHGAFFLDQKSGRIYHPDIAQYLSPDWEKLLKTKVESPHEFFAYRFKNNDPMNKANKYMTEASDWLRLFGFDLLKPYEPSRTKQTLVDFKSGLKTIYDRAEEQMAKLTFVRRFSQAENLRRVTLNGRLASKPSVFGSGFLFSTMTNENDMTLVNLVEGVAGAKQNIFESVLNGSMTLTTLNGPKKSEFAFAKSASSYRADLEAFNRLSADLFKVDIREKDVKVENDELLLRVFYFDSPKDVWRHQKTMILNEATTATKVKAWAREKALVQSGFGGHGDWTKAQRAELVEGQKVRGFVAVEIHPRLEWPQLASDATNYFFVSSSEMQHRRKNRHGKTRQRH